MRSHTQATLASPGSCDNGTKSQVPSRSGENCNTRRTTERHPDRHSGTVRIVIAEDDPGVRRTVQMTLKALGYDVRAYASGPELLVALEGDDQPIAMLLTDFEMPGLNGYELAGKLRILRPNIKVLLISGLSEESISPAAKPADWPEFLAKPFTIDSLDCKLRELLEVTPTVESSIVAG